MSVSSFNYLRVYIHTYNDKHMTIIRIYSFQSKLSLFDHCCKIPLAIDIIVLRLDIDGALGILVSAFVTLVLFKLI